MKQPARVELQKTIGLRLREARLGRGMTLGHLADLTGFTKSYLSKIENCRKVPPIGTLARISQALNVDIAYFFEQADHKVIDEGVCIVRSGERQPVIRGGSDFGYDYEILAHSKRQKHMEPFIITFPSAIGRDVYFEHEGEEFVFILSGRVEFEAGKRKWILHPGDSLCLDSAIPHRGRSVAGDAKALVIIFRPESKVQL